MNELQQHPVNGQHLKGIANAPAASPGNRAALRRSTASIHARLDHQLGDLDLSRQEDCRQFYQAHAWWPEVEGWLSRNGAAEWVPEWRGHCRADDYLSDIRGMELKPIFDVWPRRRLPRTTSGQFSAVAGACYVLIGSRMGARVIGGKLSGVASHNQMHFIFANDNHSWRPFFRWLDDQALELDIAAQWAGDVFELALDRAVRAIP